MSLYNLLFGKNPNTALVLSLISLKECDVERFRDCGIDFDNKKIWVHTRTGGGNREDYPNELLTSSPYYLGDEDDDFDSTYATYYFKFPDVIADDIGALADTVKNGISGALIEHVQQTLGREATENDKQNAMYQAQEQLVNSLRYNGGVVIFNGHTIIPLNDNAMARLLECAEKYDGEFVPYGIGVYNLIVQTDVPTWSFGKGKTDIEQDMSRVRIDTDWKLNTAVWDRYKAKFREKYPKAIQHLDDRYLRMHK